jgi:hypothetical protein
MNDPKKTDDLAINIQGSNVGGFGIGDNATIRDVSIIQGLPIHHPQANEVKQKLVELRQAIDTSEMPDFKKNDALSRLEQLAKQLEKADSPDRQSGAKYFLEQIVKIFENAKPIVDLAASLAKLLGFCL